MKNKHKNDLMIFALDTDVNLNSIKMIMRSYNITKFPSIVIDGQLYQGFVDKETMENIFNQTRS